MKCLSSGYAFGVNAESGTRTVPLDAPVTIVRTPSNFPAFFGLMLTMIVQAGALRMAGHLFVTRKPPEAFTVFILNTPLSSPISWIDFLLEAPTATDPKLTEPGDAAAQVPSTLPLRAIFRGVWSPFSVIASVPVCQL